MIKAVIFDIGGVLLRWTNLPMFEDIDQTLQITEEQRNEAWEKLCPQIEVGKITEEEFWRRFKDMTQSKAELPHESLLQREFKKRFSLNPDVMKIVGQLKANNVALGIISNTMKAHTDVMYSKSLFSEFDEVVLSHEVGQRKPSKEIFELTLHRLSVRPEEAVFVDDLPENIIGCKKVGISGIVFTSAEQLRHDLNQLGVVL